MYKDTINFIKELYNTDQFIPLHEPRFVGNEKKYLNECIDSTFVSSVGKFVDQFEADVAKYTGAKYAIATVNGTAALHIALLMAGVEQNDEVITQPLTFIATCNALSYIGAKPVFVDVDRNTLGLSPEKLAHFLANNTEMIHGECINKTTKRKIKAVVPMHTFGLPININELITVCQKYNIEVVEDAAESLGSYYNGKHTGTSGLLGTLSFNGNKTITTGGGGMILTNNEALAKKAKHITTTAKIPHRWDFEHDMIAYNYRLPNLNAALGCAQMESLPSYIKNKRELASVYQNFFKDKAQQFVLEPDNTKSNYWLNALIFSDLKERNSFLEETNDNGVMTRPIWKLMNNLSIYGAAQTGDLENATWLEDRVVNIPSSVII
ncbi:LegC family aminotransferase [Oceanihabitans sp. 2_MG-2023]|uniref:LegC family aminotransferase n=1 Tax=Oceanihabitans sp. 2_MG-2023 TaxID=3062661 RepID=UPI0026E475B4|nr:LegC family aminotransferase [Oceanihabitans sp. 2_MG-2023]MDO6595877.1 LegC family aminotransferase [Oceanihabitans sp. 2_MG-2023]